MHTRTVCFTEHPYRYKMVIEYGFDFDFAFQYHQMPGFSITGHLYSTATYSTTHHQWHGYKPALRACGCIHDQIAKHAKSLAPLIEWHSTHTNGLKWFWYDNGIYAFKNAIAEMALIQDRLWLLTREVRGRPTRSLYPTKPDERYTNVQRFIDHTHLQPGEAWPKVGVHAWLTARIPVVQARFRAAMEAGGLSDDLQRWDEMSAESKAKLRFTL